MDEDSISLVFKISQRRLLNHLLLKVEPTYSAKTLYIRDGYNMCNKRLSPRVIATPQVDARKDLNNQIGKWQTEFIPWPSC